MVIHSCMATENQSQFTNVVPVSSCTGRSKITRPVLSRNTTRKAIGMLCYCLGANRKITTAENIDKENTLPRTDNRFWLISRPHLLLDVSALWVDVSPFRSVKSVYSCLCCFLNVTLFTNTLHQFLGLKEAFEVLHLPNASDDEDECLGNGPPENTLVGALARHAEPLLPIL